LQVKTSAKAIELEIFRKRLRENFLAGKPEIILFSITNSVCFFLFSVIPEL